MKKIDEIFELLDGVIPANAEQTIMFCEIEKSAYEIFYYSFYESGLLKHSSEIIDSGEIDASVVENGFDKIADFIRNSEPYNPEQRNVITVIIKGTSEKVEVKQYDKSVGLYKIKKDWKSSHIVILQ